MSLIRLCEKFHSLPNAGGLLDQDSLFVHMINNVSVWDYQRAEMDKAKGKSGTGAAA